MMSRRLTGWKVMSLALVFSALWSMGCGEDDSIVSLNVSLKDTARAATSLELTISQIGHSDAATSIKVPTTPVDGGAIAKTDFYERITLPGDYTDGDAKLHVVAKQGASSLASADTTIVVRAEGAVAGFVTLGEAKPAKPVDAGVEDKDAGK
jgi:hypothetical protein